MNNSGGEVFQSALSDFTFEAACGAAIRHLADSGLTAKQIMERLDYPVSGERVRKALYKHLCDSGVILEESPEEGLPGAKPEYVLEYNSYGKPSYRRKSAPDAGGNGTEPGPGDTAWKEILYTAGMAVPGRIESGKAVPGKAVPGRAVEASKPGEELSAFLAGRISSKQEKLAYISCDFGIPDSPAAKGIPLLNSRQREYLEGIPWPRRRVYHRLDHRMTEILCNLYELRAYEGICYFPSSREKMSLG